MQGKKILQTKPEKMWRQAISELVEKPASKPRTATEQADLMLKEYMPNVMQCLEKHRKLWPNIDFYIKVLHKAERLSPKIRTFYTGSLACPTPNYDQDLFKFNHKDEKLEFLWSIPNRDTCKYYIQNKDRIPIEEWDLLKTVLDYKDGTLFKKAKELNGEKMDSGLLENRKNVPLKEADPNKVEIIS